MLEKINERNNLFRFCWVSCQCEAGGSEESDWAVASAATNRAIVGTSIPRTDYETYIRQVGSNWKVKWVNMNNNKLRTIKPNIESLKTCHSKIRKWEIKSSRLRIGHIKLTQ